MKRSIVMAAALLLPAGAFAGEHPAGQEHPSGSEPPVKASAQEHPQGQEHPKAGEHPAAVPAAAPATKAHEHPPHEHPVGSKAWSKQMNREYVNMVEEHVARTAGGFKVRDEKLAKDWDLKLLRIHKDKIVHLGENRFFACADFVTNKAGGKAKLDLDFYARKDKNGAWVIEQTLVHKVDGKARYTYNDKNEMVPVK